MLIKIRSYLVKEHAGLQIKGSFQLCLSLHDSFQYLMKWTNNVLRFDEHKSGPNDIHGLVL